MGIFLCSLHSQAIPFTAAAGTLHIPRGLGKQMTHKQVAVDTGRGRGQQRPSTWKYFMHHPAWNDKMKMMIMLTWYSVRLRKWAEESKALSTVPAHKGRMLIVVTSVSTCLCAKSLQPVSNSFGTPWAAVCQAFLFMEFSRQKYWSGLPFPPPGDLPHPGIKSKSLTSPALAGWFFTTSTTREVPFCGGSAYFYP